MVWALYPESNQRTLEDIDLLFAADTPWTWDAERTFAQLKAENPDLSQAADRMNNPNLVALDPEIGKPEQILEPTVVDASLDISVKRDDGATAKEYTDK